MDGTFYQKSGIISGGSHDLARKAKRWDEKHMAQLKSQKEKLAEDLKELVKKSRKGSELATVESQIKGLENRLKYSQKDLESSKKAIQNYEKNLKDLESELNAISVSIFDTSLGNLLENAFIYCKINLLQKKNIAQNFNKNNTQN